MKLHLLCGAGQHSLKKKEHNRETVTPKRSAAAAKIYFKNKQMAN